MTKPDPNTSISKMQDDDELLEGFEEKGWDEQKESRPLVPLCSSEEVVPVWGALDTAWVVVALFAWLLFAMLIPSSELPHVWAMPLLGMCTGTIGNTFPVAGGVIFVPVLLLLGEPIQRGVAFSVATETFGNGIFGVGNWLLKDPEAFVWPVLPPIFVGSFSGVLVAMFGFPAEHWEVRIMFAVFSGSLALRVLYQLYVEEDVTKEKGEIPAPLSTWTGAALVGVGLFGGLCVGYIGLGIESVVFFALTAGWGIPDKKATVTAIAAIGGTAAFAFAIQLAFRADLPVYKWLMILPGVCMGAKVAPFVRHCLGQRNLLHVLWVLLVCSAIKALV